MLYMLQYYTIYWPGAPACPVRGINSRKSVGHDLQRRDSNNFITYVPKLYFGGTTDFIYRMNITYIIIIIIFVHVYVRSSEYYGNDIIYD